MKRLPRCELIFVSFLDDVSECGEFSPELTGTHASTEFDNFFSLNNDESPQLVKLDRMTLFKTNNKTTRFVYVSLFKTNCIPSLYIRNNLCRLFSPHVVVFFRPSTLANGFTPSWIWSWKCSCVKRDIICNIGILFVINLPSDNEGDNGR